MFAPKSLIYTNTEWVFGAEKASVCLHSDMFDSVSCWLHRAVQGLGDWVHLYPCEGRTTRLESTRRSDKRHYSFEVICLHTKLNIDAIIDSALSHSFYDISFSLFAEANKSFRRKSVLTPTTALSQRYFNVPEMFNANKLSEPILVARRGGQ
jgi:hypothetical protein